MELKFSFAKLTFLLLPVAISQDPRLQGQLQAKHGDNLEEKSLTVCSGTDLVNINYLHLVFPDAKSARVR